MLRCVPSPAPTATTSPLRRAARALGAFALAGAAWLGFAAPASASVPAGMQPLADDELSAVRGADGIAFNLTDFSLTSSLTNPLTFTYLSPNGSSLTLSGIDLSRTDDADTFADPYQLTVSPGATSSSADVIGLSFPLNTDGTQLWSLTADFSNCDVVGAAGCTGTNFEGGTLQVSGLAMKGGGLFLSTPSTAGVDGIAFGLSTALQIASLSVYSRGRDATGTIDTSDALTISGISLTDATTGGAWVIADVAAHPGLINAVTDSTGSYLHLQIGWPTTSAPVPAATLSIANVQFVTNGATTSLGTSSIASMQLNYLDIKFKTGQ